MFYHINKKPLGGDPVGRSACALNWGTLKLLARSLNNKGLDSYTARGEALLSVGSGGSCGTEMAC